LASRFKSSWVAGRGDPAVGNGWKKKLPVPGVPGAGLGLALGLGLGAKVVGLGVAVGKGLGLAAWVGLGLACWAARGLSGAMVLGLAGRGDVGAGDGKVKGVNGEDAPGWVGRGLELGLGVGDCGGLGVVGRIVVGLKAVKGPEVGGKAEGVGAGVGAGEPACWASLLMRTSSPLGKA